MSTETVYYLLPELLLIVVATLIYLGGAFAGPRRTWTGFAVLGIIVAGIALFQQRGLFLLSGTDALSPLARFDSSGMPIAADLFGQYVRWLTLLVGLLFVLLSSRPGRDVPPAEYLGTLLMALAGVMLVGSARELVLLFLGLELLSIPTYILLYVGRKDVGSQESATKYFFLSILSSALLLYGFSFLYGIAGSTNLAVVREVLARGSGDLAGSRLLARIAMVLVFAGLGFRFTAVPFHFYAPDVYQGTTNGNAGFLSVFPKIAGFVALVRVLLIAMPNMETFGWRVALILAALTMTLGNVLALWQDNFRRLMAYSSIAHAGYMLIGISVGFATAGGESGGSFDGTGAMLFYLAVYAFATTGTFAALAYLGQPDRQVDGVDELAGVGRTHPWAGLAIAVFMFSLAGLPPLAGFWGKLALFASALGVDGTSAANSSPRIWFIVLAVIGGLNAAIASAYYLRIIGVVYFRSPVSALKAQGGRGPAAAMLLGAALVVLLGLYPIPLFSKSSDASQSAGALPPSAPKAIAAR